MSCNICIFTKNDKLDGKCNENSIYGHKTNSRIARFFKLLGCCQEKKNQINNHENVLMYDIWNVILFEQQDHTIF